ncbi:MAG TPA: nitroreductase family deazaflavin-dependent oxidoreductase [Actinopolymorphaceae bacterium]|jgi:deazaflavin-dependent oxidoreductase (nitroreductase family)
MSSYDGPTGTPTDSPWDWVNAHTKEYVESNGAKGHIWQNVPTLLITTKGRRTGRARRTPLIYGRDGDNYLVVASKGGSDTHPEWFLNLTAHPHVELQVGAERLRARARVATPAEKPRLWSIMTKIWPDYDNYQKSTTREIPVVVLEPLAA